MDGATPAIPRKGDPHFMRSDSGDQPRFVLLSNHGHALVAIAESPDLRIREIAARLGITERATQTIVNDLVAGGYVRRTRVGRRNSYTVEADKPFPHPALGGSIVGSLLAGVAAWSGDGTGVAADAGDDAAADGLDRLTALAAALLRAPIGFVATVDAEREIIINGVGVPEHLLRRDLPLEHALCRHVVATAAPVVIADAGEHPLTRTNPVVTEHGVRAYIGLPLPARTGPPVGSLCVADLRPRRWTSSDVQMLTSLAAAAASQLEIQALGRRHRQAAERYRTLLDSLPETLILVLDRDLRIQTASGAALRRSGLPPAELVGHTLEAVTGGAAVASLRAHYEAGLAGHRHQFVHTAADGRSYAIEVVPLTGPDGTVDSVMSIGREQLALAGEDHWDTERLRTLIENVPGAIYRCAATSDWRMLYISPHIEAISGYPAADFVENAVRSFASIIHRDDRGPVERAVAAAAVDGRPFVLEYRVVTRAGGVQWVRERGRAVTGPDGAAYLDGAIFAIEEPGRSLAAA
jgi:PAS domain S-box-containing protein